MRMINLGCGRKFHPDWVNVDSVSRDPSVRKHDLSRGIPFESGSFDVLYHSQLLEHFPRAAAPAFVAECFRVLAPGGIARVVVPDLEGIAREYIANLERCLAGEPAAEADYDWILLELLDQSVRTQAGGEMATYLTKEAVHNEAYVQRRIGPNLREIRSNTTDRGLVARAVRRLGALARATMPSALGLGRFRQSGEIHQWMYDRFSLARLHRSAGFVDIRYMDAHTSAVADWSRFSLDARNGEALEPASIIMEARRPC
jgi:predicted SAM-dependent methyltransferase